MYDAEQCIENTKRLKPNMPYIFSPVKNGKVTLAFLAQTSSVAKPAGMSCVHFLADFKMLECNHDLFPLSS